MNANASDRSIETLLKLAGGHLWRRKSLFLLSTVLFFCLFMNWVIAQQPVYEGTVLLAGGQATPNQSQEQGRKDSDTSIALLTRIAESDEVVKAAASDVGISQLAPPLPPSGPSLFGRLRRYLHPTAYEPMTHPGSIDAELGRIKSGLVIRGEQNASIIRISFRNPDPELAARFANSMSVRLIERHTLFGTRLGAANFFLQQRQRFEQEAAKAAKGLQAFSSRTSLFSVDEQRGLLLRRRDALALSLATTKGLVSQKLAERQTLAEELRKLMPVARSPYVSSLVDSLGGDRSGPRPDSRIVDDRTTDPPLLLIRVYQETMAALFKVNADVVGAQSLMRQQSDEIEAITAELGANLQNQEEFMRLKSDVDRATANLELYSRRMVEEQISAELGQARFSSVKVLQEATPAMRPSFPNYQFMTALAAIVAAIGGAIVALLFRRRSSPKKHYSSTLSSTSIAS
jgi:uncharacterized protein involved in exopolysaccharide biosynthesis